MQDQKARRSISRRSAMGAAIAAVGIGTAPQHARAADALARRIAEIRERFGLPGLAAARLDVGATQEWAAGSRRLGSRAAVEAGDRWHIGSCTKSMTATLISLAVEKGLVRWDMPLAEAFADVVSPVDPAFAGVTVAMLASHRSGISGGIEVAYAELWRSLWDPHLDPATGRRLVAERILSQRPDGEPGRFVYSNWNYALLGALIDQRVGVPFEEVIGRELFAPLGLTTCGFGPPAVAGEPEPSQPWFHRWAEGRWRPVVPDFNADNPPTINPAGRVHCSLGDWLRYAKLHIDGARGRNGAVLLTRAFEPLHLAAGLSGYTAGGWFSLQRSWSAGPVLHHTGSNTIAFASIWIAPAEERAFVAAANCGRAPGIDPQAAIDAAIAAMVETVGR